jgi:pimeloyl-ACP methyl ester carboxylesterase
MNEFRIEVPQEALDDLQRRLDSMRWPDQLEGVEWSYGVELGRLRDLVEHWRTTYRWRAFEQRVNALPQYRTEIDGQLVHFFHLRSSSPDAIPLLLTHGWPGSGADFLQVAEKLTDFHLVVPSIPGFGFSGPTTATGWDVDRIAAAWSTLMEQLGYSRYGVHGGDWGAKISPALARLVPDRITGLHLNAFTAFPQDKADLDSLPEADQQRLAGLDRWQQERSGYAAIQSTRPQTLAYALADSPVGQLAWNLEWFDDYGHHVGAIDDTLILDNVTLTWLTGTAGSSARLYKEAAAIWAQPVEFCPVPTALAVFPGDSTSRVLAERQHRIVRFTEYETGGHFAALQTPDLLARDLQAFFRDLG